MKIRKKISTKINLASKLLFRNPAFLRNLLKPVIVNFINLITLGRGITVNIGRQGEFKMSPQFYFSNWKNFGDRHNSGFLFCLEQSINKRIVLDIGAHIGLFSMPLSDRISPGGKIYAFEPSEINRHYLKKHLELNDIKNVEVLPYLVGAKNNKKVEFYEDQTQVNPMGGVILSKYMKNDAIITHKQMVSLDAFCKDNDIQPELIKIDVEGAEIDLLLGAKNVLLLHKPVIVLSLHPQYIEKMNQSLSDLRSYLEEVNFKCLTIDGKDNNDFHQKECILLPSKNQK
tara:strand:+ start:626 stop:1483 length:858 start_codon:yes stop_codon:yes gene_type:complete